jgi:outer membrane protein assembly factor BamB
VDLNAGLAPETEVVAYALAEFTSPRARDAEVRLGCYTVFKLWVNGELVLDRGDAFTGMSLDHYVAKVRLQAGKNLLLMKVSQDVPPPQVAKLWRFQLRVCDAGGAAVPSAPTPPPQAPKSGKEAGAGLAGSLLPLLLGVADRVDGGADWRQFRGTDSTGVATGEAPPAEVGGGKNVAWKAKLPGRGLSAPIVVGERVFLTTSSGHRQDRVHVLAFDARTGRELWQRTFWATGPTDSHPKTCMAAPTPASDGTHLLALFGTNDLVCLDLEGNVLWIRSLYEENPGATDGRGLASSPLLVRDTAIIQVECQNSSFTAGIDLRTGANRWRRGRPRQPCWTSPIVLAGKAPADALVLLQGTTRLSACDPVTGKEIWGLDRASDPIASAVTDGRVLFVPGDKGMTALELQPGGRAPKLLWEQPRLSAAGASPVLLGDRIYSMRGSVLVGGEKKTGKVVNQLRLKGTFYASLVSAGGLVYCINEDGLAQVVRPGEKEATLVASGEMGENILATPAIAGGALYVRSDRHLWKLAKAGERSGSRDGDGVPQRNE